MFENSYNKKSSTNLGWEPEWFGCTAFNDELIEKIREFQEENGLKQDGKCGPITYARLVTAKEHADSLILDDNKNYIILAGVPTEINYDKVSNLLDSDGLALPRDCYRRGRPSLPSMVVTHWDAALSARSCHDILRKRGLSYHFVIDNDGKIFQLVDPAHEAWHAGSRATNRASIGVCLSNAVYTKYQNTYIKRGCGKRPNRRPPGRVCPARKEVCGSG